MKKKKIYLLILLLVLFITNTVLMKLGILVPIDDIIHSSVISLTSEVVTKFMRFITFLGSTKFMILLSIALFIIFYVINKTKGIVTVCMITISTIINSFIKVLIRRPRPLYILINEKTFSYPSGHMMASVTMYGFLIYLLLYSKQSKSNKIIWSLLGIILIMLIGMSRIYFGAHYFSDILGATYVSLIILTIFSIINDKCKFIQR